VASVQGSLSGNADADGDAIRAEYEVWLADEPGWISAQRMAEAIDLAIEGMAVEVKHHDTWEETNPARASHAHPTRQLAPVVQPRQLPRRLRQGSPQHPGAVHPRDPDEHDGRLDHHRPQLPARIAHRGRL
jgi:hypothetical protein